MFRASIPGRSTSFKSALAGLLLAATPALAGGQSLKVPAGKAAAAIQSRIAVGNFKPLGHALSPCVPSWEVPYYEERTTSAPWIGRFRIVTHAPGNWFLVVSSRDGDRPAWRVSLASLKPSSVIDSEVFPLGRVAISLEADPQAAACPVVILDAEVQRSQPAETRGQVGGRDDRWFESGKELAAPPEGPRIRAWAPAVVRMEVVAPTGLLVPCTGYFISANILMTAAHCVSTDEGAGRAVVYLGPRTVTGGEVRLIMAQGLDLDFSLLWVSGANSPTRLELAGRPIKPLAVWQAGEPEKKVSVFECSLASASNDDFVHTCDTVGGSSGSPVQDFSSGQVVGIHVAGCTTSNATGACRNGAKQMSSIRERIKFFSAALKAGDPEAAKELSSASLLSPDK